MLQNPRGVGGGVSPGLVDLRVSGSRISGLKGLSAAGAKCIGAEGAEKILGVSACCLVDFLGKLWHVRHRSQYYNYSVLLTHRHNFEIMIIYEVIQVNEGDRVEPCVV